MNEFIKKLIERLEEKALELYDDELGEILRKDEAIGIINQLAEEYKAEHIVDLCNQFCDKADEILQKDNNVITNDLAIVQSLPSLYPLQPFEEEAVHRVVGRAKNQGWIPCSSSVMPKENEEVRLTFKNSAGFHTGEATYKNKMFFYVTDTQFGYYEEVYKNPIAWKPKDAPYQPKGE